MKFNAEKNMFNAGDKVVVRKWDDVVDDVKYNDNDPLSIERRLECAHLYGGKVAVVVEWGNDVYGGEDKVALVPIYRLADESGNIIPFAFKNCMLARWESNDAKEEAKQADDATEEKFADRPQILKGDIVRFISALTGEENVEVVRCKNPEIYCNSAFGKVLAVYRFDGRDFKCVWESVGYQFDRFKRIIDGINKTQLTLSVKLKSVNEAMEKLAKEAGTASNDSEKAD